MRDFIKNKLYVLIILVLAITYIYLKKYNKIHSSNAILFFLIYFLVLRMSSKIRNFRFSRFFRHFTFYVTMVFPFVIFYNTSKNMNVFNSLIFGLILSTLIMLFKIKHTIKIIKRKTVFSNIVIEKKEKVIAVCIFLILPVIEEMFFRGFLVRELYYETGYWSVVITSILFVIAHIFNYAADKLYNTKMYFLQFILSVAWSYMYIYTQSLLGCIISHLVMDLEIVIEYLVRPTNQKMSEFSFDDY